VKKQFPGAAPKQLELLTARMVGGLIHASKPGQPDIFADMSEMEQSRLQMAMDRRSKLIETLSNIMKKASETSESVVTNLK
jgi:hypothetical protein